MNESKWSENVILIDADFLDHVTFDLIVNFERMIDRRIPAGNLCHWLDCVALDGGLRPGDNDIQAIFIHAKDKKGLQYMQPADFDKDLDGKAFKDNLGEFTLHSFPVEEIVSAEDFFVQSVEGILQGKDVRRLLVVADMERYGERVKQTVAKADEDKKITLFTMQPITGRGFEQEILGYSLMSALGIRGEELG